MDELATTLEGRTLVRTTPEFTIETVPDGLLSAHRVADGVYGVLRVIDGSLDFVLEASGDVRVLRAGDAQLIEPGVMHHVDPGDDVRFVIEFWR